MVKTFTFKIIAIACSCLLVTGLAYSAEKDNSEVATFQTAPSALSADLQLSAEASGWTLEQETKQYYLGQKLDRILEQIQSDSPDQFIGAELPSTPDAPAVLYLKGHADQVIFDAIARAEIPVTVVDEQPYSIEELSDRSSRVVDLLDELGFDELSASYEFSGRGKVDVTVRVPVGSNVDRSQLIASILLATGVPVDLTIIESDTPIFD